MTLEKPQATQTALATDALPPASPTTASTTTEPPSALLVWLVRCNGMVLLTALLPIGMPVSWMQVIHDQLGIGTFPQVPVVVYLARSLSATYALHGLLTFWISLDLTRFRPLLGPLIGGNAALGMILLVIDLTSSMPWFWTLCEGPPIIAYALAIAWAAYREHR